LLGGTRRSDYKRPKGDSNKGEDVDDMDVDG